jgi:hypothetical protein
MMAKGAEKSSLASAGIDARQQTHRKMVNASSDSVKNSHKRSNRCYRVNARSEGLRS